MPGVELLRYEEPVFYEATFRVASILGLFINIGTAVVIAVASPPSMRSYSYRFLWYQLRSTLLEVAIHVVEPQVFFPAPIIRMTGKKILRLFPEYASLSDLSGVFYCDPLQPMPWIGVAPIYYICFIAFHITAAFLSVTSFLMFHSFHILNRTTTISEKTRRMQKKLMVYLALQIGVPLATLVTPWCFFSYAVVTRTIVNPAIHNFFFMVDGLHGTMSSIAVITLTEPYRKYVFDKSAATLLTTFPEYQCLRAEADVFYCDALRAMPSVGIAPIYMICIMIVQLSLHCVILCLFFVCHSFYLLNRATAISERTRRMQKKIIRYLGIQVAVPLCTLVIPWCFYALIVVQRTIVSPSTNNFFLIVDGVHATMSSIAIIALTEPYRKYFIRKFRLSQIAVIQIALPFVTLIVPWGSYLLSVVVRWVVPPDWNNALMLLNSIHASASSSAILYLTEPYRKYLLEKIGIK
ncbi:unnamed protein product, partial [Mesorhabditis spiculigera]